MERTSCANDGEVMHLDLKLIVRNVFCLKIRLVLLTALDPELLLKFAPATPHSNSGSNQNIPSCYDNFSVIARALTQIDNE
jgi:hypothetical protein